MDAFQAIVLSEKLCYLELWNKQRQQIADLYRDGLRDIEVIQFQEANQDKTHVYHLFPILMDERDELGRYLDSKGIQTRVIYPIPLHMMDAYRKLGYEKGEFPNVEEICSRVLCLPVYPGMSQAQAEMVISGIRQFVLSGV